jgi:hypothetical protein
MKRSIGFHAKLAAVVASAAMLSMASGEAVAAACTQTDINACLQVCGPARIYDITWYQCFQACLDGRCQR